MDYSCHIDGYLRRRGMRRMVDPVGSDDEWVLLVSNANAVGQHGLISCRLGDSVRYHGSVDSLL